MEWFEGLLDREEGRRGCRDAALPEARRLSGRVCLVHRTGKPVGAASGAAPGPSLGWRRIFEEERLAAEPVRTDWEAEAGAAQAVYLFLGAPAYPRGQVALVFAGSLTPQACTPFDTGGLRGGFFGAGSVGEDEARRLFFAAYTDGSALPEVCAHWIAAHFDDPLDYLRGAQRSAPQRPALHGLQGADGDRRAWTVEVQVHEDLPLEPSLRRVVLARRADSRKLPDRWAALAEVAADETELDEEEFYGRITNTILRFAKEEPA